MPSCEKCWADAYGNPVRYSRLIKERKDNKCSPEEQAGEYASICPKCNRRTIHQYANICMNPDCVSGVSDYQKDK